MSVPVASGKPRLLILDERLAPLVAELAAEFEFVEGWREPDLLSLFRREGRGVRALLTIGRDRIDAAALALLPDLELICGIGAGIEGVDLAAARAAGVVVANGGAANSPDVADHAVALWLAARQQIAQGRAWILEDRWAREGMMPHRNGLSGERVGIVGLGNIGQEIARRAEVFGAEVAWWGPRPHPELPWPRRDSLMDLAAWSTTLMVAARGDEDSRGLITAEVIRALGPKGLFVNVSRGFVVDEDALIAALRAGELGMAALDVFREEPARPARWKDVPNLLLTPHSASLTFQAAAALRQAALRNIRTVLTREAPENGAASVA